MDMVEVTHAKQNTHKIFFAMQCTEPFTDSKLHWAAFRFSLLFCLIRLQETTEMCFKW